MRHPSSAAAARPFALALGPGRLIRGLRSPSRVSGEGGSASSTRRRRRRQRSSRALASQTRFGWELPLSSRELGSLAAAEGAGGAQG